MDFYEDGEIAVEVFKSNGVSSMDLNELIAMLEEETAENKG